MKRMDRLLAIVLALQQRPESAQSLADKWEVSKRTIIRDIQVLSEMGVPIYSQPGPSGGYRLMEGYWLPPLSLSFREALAVLFALQSMQRYADTPFNRERWTVMDKLRGIMPKETAQEADRMLGHLEAEVPERNYSTPFVDQLLEIAAGGAWIRADYRSMSSRKEILIHPRRIFAAHGFWYCEAYSQTHGEERTFRVDRFVSVELAESPIATAPTNHNGASAKQSENYFSIRATLTYKGALMAEADPHLGEAVHPVSDDCWMLACELPESEREWAIRFFFQMGLEAEVLEPACFRRELQQLAKQLEQRYQA